MMKDLGKRPKSAAGRLKKLLEEAQQGASKAIKYLQQVQEQVKKRKAELQRSNGTRAAVIAVVMAGAAIAAQHVLMRRALHGRRRQ